MRNELKVAIIHEGNAYKSADSKLLTLLIKHLKLDIEQVEFYGMGNKSNFFKNDHAVYELIKNNINEELIKGLLFVIDADNDDKTHEKLDLTITKFKLNVPTDIYITCDPDTQKGYLESLILSTIPKEQKQCINNFLACSEFKSKQNHKAILHQIYNTAYPKAPFDFSHQNFNPLKQKIIDLFQ